MLGHSKRIARLIRPLATAIHPRAIYLNIVDFSCPVNPALTPPSKLRMLMNTHTVSTLIINSRHAQDYFTNGDRRIMIGLRAALEMLALPVPDYARRKMPGQSPAKAAFAAFSADNPTPRSTVLAERKPNAVRA